MTARLAVDHVTGYRCLVCGREYAPGEVEYVCEDHGNDGVLDVQYDYEELAARWDRADVERGPESMWRFRPLLPVDPTAEVPPLRIGWTPLYPTPRLAADLGLRAVWVKDETVEPTGSLKDRASAVAVMRAVRARQLPITTASTGNAAAALAGVCASMGIENVIFVPDDAPEAKIAQLLSFGSTVLLVEGGYDAAIDLCLRAADRFGWYNRTTGFNPHMSEGKKTVAFEIALQLRWEVPDVVVTGVGDGCIIGSLYAGFRDLTRLGWIDRIPRLIGVQAAGSAFLAEAWERRQDVLTKPPIRPHTVADSISSALPRDRLKAMRAVEYSAGAFVTVSDERILASIPTLARGSGVFCEPAAAATHAGLARAVEDGIISSDDRVVLLATGSGLKDVSSAMRAVDASGPEPHRVPPTLDAVAAAIGANPP
jgi:threonine synthase